MYYICIENNNVVSVVNYRPSVPNTVSVVEITDEQHNQISAGTHKFDISTKSVIVDSSYSADAVSTELSNSQNREFLRNTDWKILRHIRQKALGQSTTLTNEEYLALETQRAEAAALIV